MTTTRYLYSTGTRPLAQYVSGGGQYLLPDGLGSVRQIADVSGNVVLTESYDPYGNVLNSSGSDSSIFGYGGEEIDTYIKVVFLRSRYYDPGTGRFLTEDVWQGDYTRPPSLDAWNYTEGNPINRIDPSGLVWSCYPNAPCAQWIYGALNKLSTGGALSQNFLSLFAQDDVRYWFVVDSDNSGMAPPVPVYNHVLLSRSFLSDPLPPPTFHISEFVHETVHTFRSALERTTIFGEVEAFTVQAGILQELGDAAEVLPFMNKLISVAVEGGQVTRNLDKLAQARCILLQPEATGGNSLTDALYRNEALIWNYGQAWWESCSSCGNP